MPGVGLRPAPPVAGKLSTIILFYRAKINYKRFLINNRNSINIKRMVDANFQQNIEQQLERLLSQLTDIEEVQDSGEIEQEELE